MNKISTMAIGIALGTVAASSASAQWLDSPQAVPDGIYGRLEAGWSHVPSLDGSASAINGRVSADYTTKQSEGAIGGGAVGYKWGAFRGEVNVDYSQQSMKSLSLTSLNGYSLPGNSVPLTGNINNLSFMVSGFYDFATGTPFTPYVGVGVGGAHLSFNNVSTGGFLGAVPLANGSDTVFAYQPMAGVHYAIGPHVELGLEYRYIGTTDANFSIPSPSSYVAQSFKEKFESHNVLASLTWHFASPPPAPMPVTPAVVSPAPPAPPPHQAQKFLVFFDFDKSTLTEAGRKVVDAAAAAYKQGGSAHLDVSGYTDLSGTQAYNLKLSERRADTVRDALVRDGVSAADIGVSWHGKENPRVPTPDGVREPQNRRVEINLP
jgi:outer membrane protein OmpA-like peptidoglycan-associated protein